MAIAQVQEARAEAAAREGEIAALRERQAMLLHQVQMLSSVVSVALSREPKREQDDATAARLAEVSLKLDRIETTIARSKGPAPTTEDQDIAAPRRAAEAQAEERAAAVRKVQGMLEAGEVKVTTRNGRAQLWLMRPLDAQDPYRAVKAEEQTPGNKPPNVPASPAAHKDEVRIEDPVRF
ncbi:hypothetical protein [Polyangium aurulentum]|uniref:hypothetical protein n=1 Tax=Polyangium aurulentum TaxID=2567896 RepID=UPI0010AE3F99|nr:hypothetical protein [Polyangium aurulentum]UQA62343.1 hypothetical protein E8A73_018495 [Polyangium aurulentum]